ncbi:MAG TPA: glycosyltransferase family 2 protein [Burkholderiales bacterium]|nr:glycosyltransferase family 2 protein [Burkholderiales bacterium]
MSHGQGELVALLLGDLSLRIRTAIEILLTVNVPETLPFDPARFAFPVRVMRNERPRGFGANHNAAFRESLGRYFCVLNPDIRVERDPFGPLIECLRDPRTGVVAPLIFDPAGRIEDNVRSFPTPWTILHKVLFGGGLDHATGAEYPDWVAGMFMLFPHEVFEELGGFDEGYFLYYEDVDLCARLAAAGRRVRVCQDASAVHAARRESRRSPRHMRWHLSSMLRFFLRSRGIRQRR